jgi:hypothetical protein
MNPARAAPATQRHNHVSARRDSQRTQTGCAWNREDAKARRRKEEKSIALHFLCVFEDIMKNLAVSKTFYHGGTETRRCIRLISHLQSIDHPGIVDRMEACEVGSISVSPW